MGILYEGLIRSFTSPVSKLDAVLKISHQKTTEKGTYLAVKMFVVNWKPFNVESFDLECGKLVPVKK